MNVTLSVEDRSYDITLEPGPGDGEVHVNVDAEPFELELTQQDGAVTVELGDRSFVIERKGRALFVDGERVDVGVRRLAQAGLRAGAGAGGEITPPMPGRVLEILVSEGDEVQAGQPLVVLEAMKMQNEITAPGPGVVKAIHASKGDTVEAKDVLIELDPA